VARWIAAYEAAWRSPGTDGLAGIFTPDATYRQGPYDEPVVGLPAIARMWEAERDGPDEAFQMASEIIAVDGATAVARVQVSYGDPVTQEPTPTSTRSSAGPSSPTAASSSSAMPPGRSTEG